MVGTPERKRGDPWVLDPGGVCEQPWWGRCSSVVHSLPQNSSVASRLPRPDPPCRPSRPSPSRSSGPPKGSAREGAVAWAGEHSCRCRRGGHYSGHRSRPCRKRRLAYLRRDEWPVRLQRSRDGHYTEYGLSPASDVDRSGLPECDLSLIHISEPTR